MVWGGLPGLGIRSFALLLFRSLLERIAALQFALLAYSKRENRSRHSLPNSVKMITSFKERIALSHFRSQKKKIRTKTKSEFPILNNSMALSVELDFILLRF